MVGCPNLEQGSIELVEDKPLDENNAEKKPLDENNEENIIK